MVRATGSGSRRGTGASGTGACAAGWRAPARRRHRIPTLLALLALACASRAPTSLIAPGHEGAPGVERIALVPSNLALALRPELESGVLPMDAELAGYLTRHGRGVERIPLREARRLWEETVALLSRHGEAPDLPTAAGHFARRLGEGHDVQAVVMPSLLVRSVTVRHRSAEWDGVERRIRLVNAPRPSAGRDTSLRDVISFGSLNAHVRVSSLQLSVFTREGRHVFEGRGGLEFIEEVDLANASSERSFALAPRSDLFQDPEVRREAVAVAFAPYLPPTP